LAQTQCLACHRFFRPHEYPPQAWPALVRNMGNQHFLSRQQISDITNYMVAASRATRGDCDAAPAGAAVPPADPETVLRGSALARANCAECHRLRTPQEFPAEDWPGIVRLHRSLLSLSEDDLRTMAWYYVESARSGP
jgi:mono/diheme cytochrome c family protein